jgi:hypothetical protein
VYTLATVREFVSVATNPAYKQTYLYQKQNSCDGRCGQGVNPTPLPPLSLSIYCTSKRLGDVGHVAPSGGQVRPSLSKGVLTGDDGRRVMAVTSSILSQRCHLPDQMKQQC